MYYSPAAIASADKLSALNTITTAVFQSVAEDYVRRMHFQAFASHVPRVQRLLNSFSGMRIRLLEAENNCEHQKDKWLPLRT